MVKSIFASSGTTVSSSSSSPSCSWQSSACYSAAVPPMSLCTVPPQQLLQKSLQTMHKSVGNHIRTSSPSSLPCSPTTIAHSFGSKGQINGSSGEIFVLICSMDGFKPGMCHYPSAAPYFSSHFVTAAFPFGHARHISFRQKYLRGFMRNSSQRRLTLTLGAAQRQQSRNMCTQKKLLQGPR